MSWTRTLKLRAVNTRGDVLAFCGLPVTRIGAATILPPKLNWPPRRAWLRYGILSRSTTVSSSLGGAGFRSNALGGFHGLDVAPVVGWRIGVHATLTAVGKTKFAIVVDANKPKRFRFPDRWRDSVAAQAVFDKLRGGDLQATIVVPEMVRQLDLDSRD